MSKQQSKDELMAEFFRMLMADAQQAQKASSPHEEYTMDSFPRYREADHVRKYTVRVALRGIKPPIWRKVIVPSNISLRLFGDLILELMGWMGEHLNQFRKGDSYYAPAYQREGELPPLFGRIRNYNQEDFALGEILCEKGAPLTLERAGTGKHIFTHIEWHMTALAGELDGPDLPEGWVWADRAALRDTYAVPNAFQSFSQTVADRLGRF